MIKKNDMNIEKINKENPFKVPDTYFDTFSTRMSDKISETQSIKEKIPAYSWLQPKYAFVLVIAGIALAVLIDVFVFNTNTPRLSSQEMVEAYKYSAIQDLSDEQLAQMMVDKQSHPDTTSAYQKDVIDYLSEENIDINTIIEAQ